MKNYRESDYALNKYSPNIVYKFDDKIVEVTLEDYLAQNPDRTAEDFAELKALSDEMYHEQVVTENRTSRLDVSIDSVNECELVDEVNPMEILSGCEDAPKANLTERELLERAKLTEIQIRRFTEYVYRGKSLREIANSENVHFTSVEESIEAAKKKLKKYYKNF